jgi:DNA gyrase subunit A
MGRATQGVRLIRLDEDDQIASVARVQKDESTEAPEGNSASA